MCSTNDRDKSVAATPSLTERERDWLNAMPAWTGQIDGEVIAAKHDALVAELKGWLRYVMEIEADPEASGHIEAKKQLAALEENG